MDFDLEGIDLTDESDAELKKLSPEDEAMKVLTRLARENGLTEEDDELIRQIYQEAVAAHDNDQNDSDAATMGRKLYEKISSDILGKEGEK